MFFNYTKHAIVRMQQRGKSAQKIKMVLRYGTGCYTKLGVFFKKQDAEREINRRKRWIQRMDAKKQALRKAMYRRINLLQKIIGVVVIKDDGRVITVYNRQQIARHRAGRIKKHRKQR